MQVKGSESKFDDSPRRENLIEIHRKVKNIKECLIEPQVLEISEGKLDQVINLQARPQSCALRYLTVLQKHPNRGILVADKYLMKIQKRVHQG